jgi:transcriptional regulator with XRE-family HTH domain
MRLNKEKNGLAAFVKYNREKLGLTQEEVAEKAGVGLHFLRNLEQGEPVRTDKVDQVLALFGHRLTPAPETLDPYQVWYNYSDKAIKIVKKTKQVIYGFIVKEIRDEENKITAWKIVPNLNAFTWLKSKDDKLTFEIKHDEIASISLQTL